MRTSVAVVQGLWWLWLPGLVAPWHVGSSWTGDRTCVPCTGRRILNPWTTVASLGCVIKPRKRGPHVHADGQGAPWGACLCLQPHGGHWPLAKDAVGKTPGAGNGTPRQYSWASLGAQTLNNPPALWETRVRSLGREDPLEKEIATHSSIRA